MKFSEEQIKDIVVLKENLIEQIDKHQESIEMLEKNLIILDLVLKESSFTKASQLGTVRRPEIQDKVQKRQKSQSTDNSIPIKQGNHGKVIANAYMLRLNR